MTARTLVDLIRANRDANRSIHYHSGEHESRSISYGKLHDRALGILHHLQRLGARPGDKLILLLNHNEQFIEMFWAAILGGIVPVPVAVGISDEHRHKLLRIARKLGRPWLYSDRKVLERVGVFAQNSEDSTELRTFEALAARALFAEDLTDVSKAGTPHDAQPEDIAFIQFSSGSTSDPKGVVLTHANLISHAIGSTQAGGFNDADVSLSWMPLTHDMGLIGFHLVMFFNRVETHLMPTDLFVRRPLLWLTIADRVRATILCSPNFGYRHYLKVLGERSPGNLDLSSVRLIFNGAEPISVELCGEFLARLAARGLKRNAMFPVYGLAEASLAVSFPPVGRPLRTLQLNRHHLSVGESAQVLPDASRDALNLVSVGQVIPLCELRIAGDDDAPLPDGRIGHIHIRGENVTGGYYEEPEVNRDTFTADGWLKTGDLGLVLDGEIYITGRAKEILFVNGQNYYPHDLEAIAQRAPDMELGKVVVAGVRPPGAETDQLMVFVLHRGDLREFLPLAAEITRLINEQAGLEIAEVIPVKRIPKTTSGKIQRHLLEQQYLDGEFAAESAELESLRGASNVVAASASGVDAIENRLLNLCNAVLAPKQVGPADNLFEIGASSLKLIEIHEQVDHEYPGLIDLTELFDHPTVADLARHLAHKLTAKS
ncbi:MAG: non-ribosomal peptide synthetase [Nevskiaceae bacterium]|jgi:acyl-CoA synthetase (AMP-forming)/AMP-acid ligase II/aryl carrier-like protein|nr:non-ribosomal peptide synthetase [Nevskiaceae bacterium]